MRGSISGVNMEFDFFERELTTMTTGTTWFIKSRLRKNTTVHGELLSDSNELTVS